MLQGCSSESREVSYRGHSHVNVQWTNAWEEDQTLWDCTQEWGWMRTNYSLVFLIFCLLISLLEGDLFSLILFQLTGFDSPPAQP